MYREVTEIVLHCSDSDITGQNAAMIQAWHIARGWSKGGYSYFIQSNGKLEKMRGLEEVPAQAKGHNKNAIGICLAGRHHFTEYQFDTLKMILEFMKRIYPNAKLLAHNELTTEKSCPNFPIQPWKIFFSGL